MSAADWQSCDPRCACKSRGMVFERAGTVIYKDEDKEARRNGIEVKPRATLNFLTPDRRDMRNAEEVGLAWLTRKAAKGNGGPHEVPREES